LVEKTRRESEPSHLEELLRFASRAYRRPLTDRERDDLLSYYRGLREKSSLTHEDAMRDMIVLVLMSPDFCYRLDLGEPAPAKSAPAQISSKTRTAPRVKPVSAPAEARKITVRPLGDFALASRLSYFLWASMPDEELTSHASAGDLHDAQVLLAQS